EEQPRYFMLVIPFLAIGAGGALSALMGHGCRNRVFRSDRLRTLANTCMVGALVIMLLWNAWLPQDVRVYNRAVYAGLRNCLREARQLGFSRLVLPCYHDQVVPDSFYHLGVSLDFANAGPDQKVRTCGPIGNVRPFLDMNDTAFFIPCWI